MSPRILFGPVTAEYATRNLGELRAAGECLAFGTEPGVDVSFSLADSWNDVLARIPKAQWPEALVLYLPYTRIPSCVWTVPLPIIGLAADWNLLFHSYRDLPCDLFLTDQPGVEVLRRAGRPALPAVLYGLGADFLAHPWSDGERDLDLLFVGNMNPAVQCERLGWLGRLGRLAGRYRVLMAQGVFGEDYRRLLQRAKIVFNRGIRGEINMRAFEATATGALLFHERDNQEIAEFFCGRQQCVLYDEDALEDLVAYYLEHEEERRVIAAAGRERARSYGFVDLWRQAMGQVEAQWETLVQRGKERCERAGLALAKGQKAAAILLPTEQVGRLIEVGRAREAIELARRGLVEIQDEGALARRGWLTTCPSGFDRLRVEWERAAWSNLGQPRREEAAKRDLLMWRLHALLADLTGDLVHYHEAVLARPDLPTTRAALGCALGRAGRFAEAVPHLKHALANQPFDAAAARALAQTLSELGQRESRRCLEEERRLLAKAAPGLVREESWFAEKPTEKALVSLVILCYNQIAYTRMCLESVLDHTRSPFEVILVDNASTDGTGAFLAEFQGRCAQEHAATGRGPARVEVIRNGQNVGFPAGCNQGLAQCRGDWVVFLNNDTLVTPEWLEGLLAHGSDGVGLVGPVTNASRPPQEIVVEGETLQTLAARRRRDFAGRFLEVDRLTGFCLLARRALLDAVGGFDERYGLGFFDDDDLCVKARRAGYQLRVALDVFVHHFGSRTFAELGVEVRQLLEENLDRFRAKWGEDEAAGYRLPSTEPARIASEPLAVTERRNPAMGRMRVSLAMIVKNEEGNLGDCLRSVADLVDEVVVVDTGSTDRTREIALSFGARLHEFAWVDSFSAARNESLRHATGDFIFWMDADDRLDSENRERLRALLAALEDDNTAWVMTCLCDPEPPSRTPTEVTHVRLFRNHPSIRWDYRVHEQILPALRRVGADVRWSPIVIRHTGYNDRAVRHRKEERNLRLLQQEAQERPDDPFTLFNLGSVAHSLHQSDAALGYFRRSLALSAPSDSIVRKLYAEIAQIHRERNEAASALQVCAEGRGHYPDDAELLYLESTIRHETRDLTGAETCLRHLIGGHDGVHFRSVSVGLRGHRAQHLLGQILREQGRLAEAETAFRAALKEQPDDHIAWVRLGELWVDQSRWGEVEEAATQLEGVCQLPLDAQLLRARACLQRREFDAARRSLEAIIQVVPDMVWPRLLLSRVLLEDGRDPRAAELALNEVLRLDPGNAEANHNRDVLRRRGAASESHRDS